MFSVINPATGKVVAEYEQHSSNQIEEILSQSRDCFLWWCKTSFEERSQKLLWLSKLLESSTEAFATLITSEMGKPIEEARSEIRKCAKTCEYFAENGAKMLQNEIVKTESLKSYVSFSPLGVILGIMPWNFPFWQFFRFAAGALMAGNAIILKHAANVSGCALAIEEIIRRAGFPSHLVRTVMVSNEDVSHLIADDRIQAITITGSDKAGKIVAAQAGAVLKKCVLELGGSDPFIVLEDVDISSCVKAAIEARLVNGGQSCIAAKRFIIVKSLIQKFTDKLLKKLSYVVVGDPLHAETQIGPMARDDLVKTLEKQVADSVSKGAKLSLGGRRLDREGFFFPPTVLTEVRKGMPAFDEETFGPIFALIEVPDPHAAVKVANESKFGLGASVWTKDWCQAEEVAAGLQVGTVYINGKVVSDPRLPFGGIKDSGYGRELSHYGIKEFVNIKTVVLA